MDEAQEPKHKKPSLIRYMVWGLIPVLLIGGALAVFLLTRHHDPNQVALKNAEKSVSFPLYYPSGLASYFFLDRGSISTTNSIVIFTIDRDDGQKIFVTEQALPRNFNLSIITGTQATLPIGKLVIGDGFIGYRAAIKTPKTLIFLTSSSTLSTGDFSAVVKSFKSV
jgi:hypothetical protein